MIDRSSSSSNSSSGSEVTESSAAASQLNSSNKRQRDGEANNLAKKQNTNGGAKQVSDFPELAGLNSTIESLHSIVSTLTHTLALKNREIAYLQREMGTLAARLQRTEAVHMEQEMNRNNAIRSAEKETKNEKQALLAKFQSEKSTLESEVATLKSEISTQRDNLIKKAKDFDELAAANTLWQERATNQLRDISGLQKMVITQQFEINRLNSQVTTQQSLLMSINARNARSNPQLILNNFAPAQLAPQQVLPAPSLSNNSAMPTAARTVPAPLPVTQSSSRVVKPIPKRPQVPVLFQQSKPQLAEKQNEQKGVPTRTPPSPLSI